MSAPDARSARYVIRPSPAFTSTQGSRYAPAVSAESVGARALFMGEITLAAGQRTKAHAHGHETAHRMQSGEAVELWTGARLEHCDLVRPGDYLSIPAGMPHVAVNRSDTAAVFIGARNEPKTQESVTLLPQLDALVP
ncbi:cupin domain-containing protein [Ottowia pentelensis]|uniref:Cupin domain-containing protein n=1 Tax=Ottowia pentelensis TaxID=511108 RepID=A0ABV6PQW3_9BURK